MKLWVPMFCGIVLAAASLAADGPSLPPGIMAVDGAAAPELRLNSIDGAPYDLAGARGHWVFVHFWASWCGPCQREMPAIARMMARVRNSRIEFVMVNTAESEEEIFTFLATAAPEAVPLMDSEGRVTERWQPRGLPATFLVDPRGGLRYQALGGREWDTPPYLDFLRRLGSEPAPQASQSSR